MPSTPERLLRRMWYHMHEQEVAGHFPRALLDQVHDCLDEYNNREMWAAIGAFSATIDDIHARADHSGPSVEPMREIESACNDFLAAVSATYGLSEDN